ncbi:MAG: hypothetical protein R2834_03185 [Rhodothermales bacterium]
MKITGNVVYQDIEGGFWGIVTDDQVQYEPIEGIPVSLQRNQTRVEAEVEPVQAISFRMWGQPVRVLTIHRV